MQSPFTLNLANRMIFKRHSRPPAVVGAVAMFAASQLPALLLDIQQASAAARFMIIPGVALMLEIAIAALACTFAALVWRGYSWARYGFVAHAAVGALKVATNGAASANPLNAQTLLMLLLFLPCAVSAALLFRRAPSLWFATARIERTKT